MSLELLKVFKSLFQIKSRLNYQIEDLQSLIKDWPKLKGNIFVFGGDSNL